MDVDALMPGTGLKRVFRARTEAQELLEPISPEYAVELIQTAPSLAPGALRAYVGAVLDRLTVRGGMRVARALGVRKPAINRQRLERQIVAVLTAPPEDVGCDT